VSVSPPLVVVTLRPATVEDSEQVWLWRNDEETRQASFDSSPIPWATHEPWFLDSLTSGRRKIYVIVAGDQPSGVARLDLDGGQATVSIHLAPECRGRGLGPAALRALADLAFGDPGVDGLLASVKAENRASLSAFTKAGFVPVPAGSTVTLTKRRPGSER
jgi:UDP-2,4-diacetamido-2,4,6-trideoxy-beta-L-altropyranose hydrolase